MVVITFIISLVIPIQAQASYKPAPAHVDIPTTPVFHGNDCVNVICPDNGNPYLFSGVYTGTHTYGGEVAVSCTGYGCGAQDVYFDFIIDMSWESDLNEEYVSMIITAKVNTSTAPEHTIDDIDCGSGHAGYCSYHYSGMIPSSEMILDPLYRITFSVALDAPYGGRQRTSNFLVQFSMSPILDCNAQYRQTSSIVSGGSIPATSETGTQATLIDGAKYLLRTYGGPWNDGANDRYDTALRFGSDSWQAIGGFEIYGAERLCTQQTDDPNEHIVIFQASDTIFHIRVNDASGQFANNTGSMSFDLIRVESINGLPCQYQFMAGAAAIESGTIPANYANGINAIPLGGQVSVGDWVSITTSGGPWHNNGRGEGYYDIALRDPYGDWSPLTGSSLSNCYVMNGNYITAYVQITNINNLWLRVNDTDDNWSNTGSINYSIYKATYSPYPPGDCASYYQLGDEIGLVSVNANDGLGASLTSQERPRGGEIEQQRFIAVETSGIWSNMIHSSGTGAIAYETGSVPSWHSMTNYPDASCIVKLDPIGHYRVYIPIVYNQSDLQSEQWSINHFFFRVDASDFGSNLGGLRFTVYQATKLQTTAPSSEMPAADACDGTYTKDSIIRGFNIAADNSLGYYLPLMNTNNLYAIETSDGPWMNDGITPSYQVEISDDDGTTWTLLHEYPPRLCASSSDGNHVTIYIQPLEGRRYKVRVSDPDGNYIDGNSGTMKVTTYLAHAATSVLQWATCANNYYVSDLNIPSPANQVPATSSGGVQINSIETGKTYALEITDDHFWTEGTNYNPRYDAEVSKDNGATWVDMSLDNNISWALCIVHTNGAPWSPYRLYFTASNGPYRLRVNDQNGNFNDNNGYLTYILYSTSETGNTIPGNTNQLPPDWAAACYDVCNRPTSIFDWQEVNLGTIMSVEIKFSLPIPAFADWIEWARCAFQKFISWCPEHTQALKGIFSNLGNKEPFGTFLEVETGMQRIKARADAFIASSTTGGEGHGFTPPSSVIWGSSSGGEGGNGFNIWQGVTGLIPESSPWRGGPIQLVQGGETDAQKADKEAYISYCESVMVIHFGDASVSMCKLIGLLRELGLFFFFLQIGLDVSAGVGVFVYIKTQWIDHTIN